MQTLHIVPGDSAGGSLVMAIRDAGRNDGVLPFPDDLSCGPIDPDDPSARAAWWLQYYEASEIEETLANFWRRATRFEGRLVVWFGRHSARELAFFLAWADRLGERPYHVVDVTGRRFPFGRRDGSTDLSRPAQSVSIVQPHLLKTLLGAEQPISPVEREKNRRDWQRLKRENAPFRIVTEADLISAAIDCFDPLILEQATLEWQKVARLVGSILGHSSEPYFQVGKVMLQARIVALVGEGKLIAEGDPRDMSARVRLPD